MPRGKTKPKDGIYTRKDRPGYWASYIDAAGRRRQRKLDGAHTLMQAREQLAAIKTGVSKERLLGIREASDISTADLFQRYRRHQKSRIKAESYARTSGILDTLVRLLPTKAREITAAKVANLASTRFEAVSRASVHKELNRPEALSEARRRMGLTE